MTEIRVIFVSLGQRCRKLSRKEGIRGTGANISYGQVFCAVESELDGIARWRIGNGCRIEAAWRVGLGLDFLFLVFEFVYHCRSTDWYRLLLLILGLLRAFTIIWWGSIIGTLLHIVGVTYSMVARRHGGGATRNRATGHDRACGRVANVTRCDVPEATTVV